MRRAMLFVSVLAVVPLGVVAVGRAVTTSAQEGTPAAVAASVVGVWRVTVAPPLGPAHAGLVTFAADGTIRVTTQPVQPAPVGAPFATVVFGEGHGVWEPADGDAAFVVDLLGATETGAPFGTLTLRGLAALEPDGRTLSGAYALTATTPDGTAMEAGQGAFQGTRMTVEPMATPTGATPTAGTPAE